MNQKHLIVWGLALLLTGCDAPQPTQQAPTAQPRPSESQSRPSEAQPPRLKNAIYLDVQPRGSTVLIPTQMHDLLQDSIREACGSFPITEKQSQSRWTVILRYEAGEFPREGGGVIQMTRMTMTLTDSDTGVVRWSSAGLWETADRINVGLGILAMQTCLQVEKEQRQKKP
ncbi:MAG TPA: hypothetical protein VKE24_16495 [Candidatus Acidoferrales bacterium]|nr:hypothetical protein [Candidatus Acidoferrales bacterium]